MNVAWYYAVNGKRTGPVRWEAVRKAVESGEVGPDDFVWSSSFGTEWRKASTLEGLFPPPEPLRTEPGIAEDAQPKVDDAPKGSEPDTSPGRTPTIDEVMNSLPPNVAAALKGLPRKSPFTPPEAAADGAPPAPEKVFCLKSLGRGWLNTKIILFTSFSLRRWLLFAVCAMLTMFYMPGPVSWFVSMASSENKSSQMSDLGLDEMSKGGIFALSNKFRNLATDESKAISSDDKVAIVVNALRETCVDTVNWAQKAPRTRILLLAALMYVLMAAINIWFAARGHIMFLMRIYGPDDLAVSTWIGAERPLGTMLRGMLIVKLVFAAALFTRAVVAVAQIAPIPENSPELTAAVLRNLTILAMFPVAEWIVSGYIRDFVTPHVLLEGKTFLQATAASLRYMGFWFLRYILIVVAAYAAFGTAFVLLGEVFGMGLQMGILLLLSVPVFGAIITLPLHLLRRLWTLDMIFRKRPDLRTAIPAVNPFRIYR